MWAGGGGQQNLRGALAGRDQGRRVCGVQRGRWSKQGQRQRGAPDGSRHLALARGLSRLRLLLVTAKWIRGGPLLPHPSGPPSKIGMGFFALAEQSDGYGAPARRVAPGRPSMSALRLRPERSVFARAQCVRVCVVGVRVSCVQQRGCPGASSLSHPKLPRAGPRGARARVRRRRDAWSDRARKRQLTARWFCRKAAASGDWWATTTGNGAAGTTGAALAWWNHGNNTQDWQAQLAAVSKVSCTRTQARTNTRPTTHRFQQAPARLPIDMCCIDACHKHVARQEATSTLQDVCTGRSVSTCEPTFRVR